MWVEHHGMLRRWMLVLSYCCSVWHPLDSFTVSLHSTNGRHCLPLVLCKGTVSGLWKVVEPIMHCMWGFPQSIFGSANHRAANTTNWRPCSLSHSYCYQVRTVKQSSPLWISVYPVLAVSILYSIDSSHYSDVMIWYWMLLTQWTLCPPMHCKSLDIIVCDWAISVDHIGTLTHWRPGDTHMHLVCCLFGTKSLSELILTHCWLNSPEF